MIGHIDGFYVAAQIRLIRQVHKGAVLVVEGEKDARVFEHFIDTNACDIEVAFGKKNVLEALDLLEDEGFLGVAGVVDADFDRVFERTYPLQNLCVTDVHDLDLLIFRSSALDRYVRECADGDLRKKTFGSDIQAMRNVIISSTLPLGYCRLSAERQNLTLYFKGLKHDEFISIDDLSTDLDELVGAVISRSSTRCTVDALKKFMASEAARQHQPDQIVSGHDVACVLGIALRKMLGNRRIAQTWGSEVEAGLRLAFDWTAMAKTSVYKCLRQWEQNNKPYRIFGELLSYS
jgi:hypothetical protein